MTGTGDDQALHADVADALWEARRTGDLDDMADAAIRAVRAHEAANPPETVAVPIVEAKALLAGQRYCGVCLGLSPRSDDHDHNPPCRGAALETMQRQLSAIPESVRLAAGLAEKEDPQ